MKLHYFGLTDTGVSWDNDTLINKTQSVVLERHGVVCSFRLTLLEHLSSHTVVRGVCVTRSLVLCVCVVDRCLSFCTFSFCHGVVCSFRLLEHLSSHTVVRGVRVIRSLVFCVMFCRSLFVLLSFYFWSLYCLSYFYLRILITPLSS